MPHVADLEVLAQQFSKAAQSEGLSITLKASEVLHPPTSVLRKVASTGQQQTPATLAVTR